MTMMTMVILIKVTKRRGGGYKLALGSGHVTGDNLQKETSKNQAMCAVFQGRYKYNFCEVGSKASTCRKASFELIRPLSLHHRIGGQGLLTTPPITVRAAWSWVRLQLQVGGDAFCSGVELRQQEPTFPALNLTV